MVLSTLRRWLVLFILTLFVSLLAAFVLSGTVSLCADRTEATRLILMQRLSVEHLLARTSALLPGQVRIPPIGQQGIMQFKARQDQLERLRYLFDDETQVVLSQMYSMAIELTLGRSEVTPINSEVNVELSLISRNYIAATEKLLNRLEADGESAFSIHKLWPVIALVSIAWVTAVFTSYIAIFNLSYGYDLFMRDYSKVE